MTTSPLKQPSALAPIGMSLIALSLVFGHVWAYGVGREADEGTAAHLFQLLLVGQLPIVGYFALKWLPRAPGRAFGVLVLQACVGLAALGALFWMERSR